MQCLTSLLQSPHLMDRDSFHQLSQFLYKRLRSFRLLLSNQEAADYLSSFLGYFFSQEPTAIRSRNRALQASHPEAYFARCFLCYLCALHRKAVKAARRTQEKHQVDAEFAQMNWYNPQEHPTLPEQTRRMCERYAVELDNLLAHCRTYRTIFFAVFAEEEPAVSASRMGLIRNTFYQRKRRLMQLLRDFALERELSAQEVELVLSYYLQGFSDFSSK